VLELKINDVLRLTNAANDIVTVCVDGKDRFKGEIGLRRFRKSIQITEIIDTEKDAVKRALENFEQLRHKKISGVKDIIGNNEEYTEKIEEE
jgi:flagellar motor switch protein FliM